MYHFVIQKIKAPLGVAKWSLISLVMVGKLTSSTVGDEISQRVLAQGALTAVLLKSHTALLEGLDRSILKTGANFIAPPKDISLHNITLDFRDREGRADGLAVSPLVEKLPNGEVTNQTITRRHHD
jgi:hypothetical protein